MSWREGVVCYQVSDCRAFESCKERAWPLARGDGESPPSSLITKYTTAKWLRNIRDMKLAWHIFMHDRLDEQACQLYIQYVNYRWDNPCPAAT